MNKIFNFRETIIGNPKLVVKDFKSIIVTIIELKKNNCSI